MTQVRREERVTAGCDYRLLGVRWYGEGPFLREVRAGDEIKAVRLFKVETGDFIYNRLFAWKGSFGVIGPELDACYVSGEFPVFRPDPSQTLAEFINLVMCRPFVWSALEHESTGSTAASRNRWKEKRFSEWEVLLPPLDEQRRIVDLIATVDEAIGAAEQASAQLEQVLLAILSDSYAQMTGKPVPVDKLTEHVIGGSWGEPVGVGEVDVMALGTAAFGHRSLTVDDTGGTPRSMSAKRAKARFLLTDDILLERSGGSEDQPVGRVARVGRDLPGVVPSDFMRLVRVDSAAALPGYVFWVLWLRYMRGETLRFQTQSTNIRNLRIPEYLATEIAVPSRQEQLDFVALAEAALGERSALDELLKSEADLRAGLLDDLLSGEHEIPDPYDELLSA